VRQIEARVAHETDANVDPVAVERFDDLSALVADDDHAFFDADGDEVFDDLQKERAPADPCECLRRIFDADEARSKAGSEDDGALDRWRTFCLLHGPRYGPSRQCTPENLGLG